MTNEVWYDYLRGEYYCPECTDIDPESEDVCVYSEGDDGFTDVPVCAACGRRHEWINAP